MVGQVAEKPCRRCILRTDNEDMVTGSGGIVPLLPFCFRQDGGIRDQTALVPVIKPSLGMDVFLFFTGEIIQEMQIQTSVLIKACNHHVNHCITAGIQYILHPKGL